MICNNTRTTYKSKNLDVIIKLIKNLNKLMMTAVLNIKINKFKQ